MDGHKIYGRSSVTYSNVVSRESVRIILTIEDLNDVDLKEAGTKASFLTAPNKEKFWLETGKEFGYTEENLSIEIKALYRLKTSGA